MSTPTSSLSHFFFNFNFSSAALLHLQLSIFFIFEKKCLFFSLILISNYFCVAFGQVHSFIQFWRGSSVG